MGLIMTVYVWSRRGSAPARCREGPVMSSKIDSRGVTLVEVMISLVILLIVFMGLIQASLLSINHNMRNSVRDEAVRIAAESMSRLRSFNYACGELDVSGGFKELIQGDKTNCGYTPTLSSPTRDGLNYPPGNFRNFS